MKDISGVLDKKKDPRDILFDRVSFLFSRWKKGLEHSKRSGKI